jgi:pimeloyl-ACP methyl ester carboxylesterase
VILLHGSHGTRSDTLGHLRMLIGAGYGVLAFDARGHGQSAGQTNALGWTGARDIAGAVRFLDRQSGVDPRRIAALGLSMGAEEALRAAATGAPLSAVIADGASASTLEHPPSAVRSAHRSVPRQRLHGR